jgi:uncharacterized membrane protein YhdT
MSTLIEDDRSPDVDRRRRAPERPSPGRQYQDHPDHPDQRGRAAPRPGSGGRPGRGIGPRHHAAAPRRSWWYLLLWLGIVVPLLIPVYNRLEPNLWGIPFFFWFQMACIPIEITVITLFYQATKRRR